MREWMNRDEAGAPAADEERRQRDLARHVIDLGYRVAAKELHPDKVGGSGEAMTRLNAVRERLMRKTKTKVW
jgi:hypothetical protein